MNTRTRIRLRPEPLALPFGGLLAVLLIGSIQYANNLGFFFSFWLLAIGLSGLFGLRQRLANVSSRMIHAESGFAGQALNINLELSASEAINLRIGLEEAALQPIALRREQTLALALPLSSTERGVYGIPSLHLRMHDRLGLVRVTDERLLAGRYWVYPAPRGDRPLPPAEGASRPAGEDDFHALRDYLPGDAPSRIHWPSLARGGALQTKQFGSDATTHGPRLLDEQRLMDLPREERLSQLCAWVLACDRRNERYALRLNGGEQVPFGLGHEHRVRCLRLLAEAPRA